MLISEFSKEIKASEAKIWQIFTDVENWKEWIDGIEWSTIDGNFEDGALVTIKNIKKPKASSPLKDVDVNKLFILQAKMPLSKVDFIHEIVKDNDVVKVRFAVEIFGTLAFFFKAIFKKSVTKNLPIAAQKVIELAER
jgi:carbon monoxide dehydrogenase subunit G